MLKTPLGESALANTYAKANLADNPSQLDNINNNGVGSAFSNLNHRGASSTGAVVVKSSSAHSMLSAESCSTPNEDAEMRVSGKGSGFTERRARGLYHKAGATQEV